MTIFIIVLVVLTCPALVLWLVVGGRASEVRRLYRIGLSDRVIAYHMRMSVAHVNKITRRIR